MLPQSLQKEPAPPTPRFKCLTPELWENPLLKPSACGCLVQQPQVMNTDPESDIKEGMTCECTGERDGGSLRQETLAGSWKTSGKGWAAPRLNLESGNAAGRPESGKLDQ